MQAPLNGAFLLAARRERGQNRLHGDSTDFPREYTDVPTLFYSQKPFTKFWYARASRIF